MLSVRNRTLQAVTVLVLVLCYVTNALLPAPAAFAAEGDYNEHATGGMCAAYHYGNTEFQYYGGGGSVRFHCVLNTTKGPVLRLRFLVKATKTGSTANWLNYSLQTDATVSPPGSYDQSGSGQGMRSCDPGDDAYFVQGIQPTDDGSGVDPFIDINPNYVGSCVTRRDNDTTNDVVTLDAEAMIGGANYPGSGGYFDDWLATAYDNCGDTFYQDAHDHVAWGWCGGWDSATALYAGTSLGGTANVILDACYDVTCSADELEHVEYVPLGADSTTAVPEFPDGEPTHVSSSSAAHLPSGKDSECAIDAVGASGGKGDTFANWEYGVVGPRVNFACYFALNDGFTGTGLITLWPSDHHGAPVLWEIPLVTGVYRMPMADAFYSLAVVMGDKVTDGAYARYSGKFTVSSIDAADRMSSGGTCDSIDTYVDEDRGFALYAPCEDDHYFNFSPDNDPKIRFCPNAGSVPDDWDLCQTTHVTAIGAAVTDPGSTPPTTGLAPTSGGACVVGPWTWESRDTPGSGDWSDPASLVVSTTGKDRHWSASKEYRFTTTVLGAANITLELGDEEAGSPSHSIEVLSPDDGEVVFGPFTFIRSGEFNIYYHCIGYDGKDTGGGGQIAAGNDSLPFPGGGKDATTVSDRLGSCLSAAFTGAGSFDLLDPSTWLGSAAAVLNPISYAKASMCVVEAVAVPTKPMNHYTARVKKAYEAGGLGVIEDGVLTPVSAMTAFADGANSGSCDGPAVNFPLPGGTETLHPLASCADSTMRDVSYLGGTVIVYVGGALLVLKILSRAVGLKLTLPGSDSVEAEA